MDNEFKLTVDSGKWIVSKIEECIKNRASSRTIKLLKLLFYKRYKPHAEAADLAAPSDEGAPRRGEGEKSLQHVRDYDKLLKFSAFFSPSGRPPPSSSEEGTNLEVPTCFRCRLLSSAYKTSKFNQGKYHTLKLPT